MHDDDSDSARLSSAASSSPNSRSTSTSLTSFPPSLATSSPSRKGISHQPPYPTKDKRRSESESPPRSSSRARASEIMKRIPERYQPYARRHTFSSGEQSASQVMATDISSVESRELFAHSAASMSQDLLKRALLAKEASREYQRQNLLATAWKIEELRRHLNFAEGIQEANKGQLEDVSAELELFEYFVSGTSPTVLRSETDRLQESYDEDLLAITTMDQLLNRLEEQYSRRTAEGKETEGKEKIAAGTL